MNWRLRTPSSTIDEDAFAPGLGWSVHVAASKDTFRIDILEHEKLVDQFITIAQTILTTKIICSSLLLAT